jgi:hypothetical protein
MKVYNISLFSTIAFFNIVFSNLSFAAGPQVSASTFGDCKCPKLPTVNDAYNQSPIIFLGQVVSVEQASAIRPNYNVVKLIMTKSYKGTELLPQTDYVVVYTPDKEKDCGVSFSKQSDYLVFASGNPAFLKTTLCNLTEIQESRKAEQMKLDELIKDKK